MPTLPPSGIDVLPKPEAAVPNRRKRAGGLLAGLLTAFLLSAGCRSANWALTAAADRPRAHRMEAAGFVVLSDIGIAEDAPLLQELRDLRDDVMKTLQLPPPRDPVIVYLFDSEGAYRRYMKKTWPDLPSRRAYFIGTSRELAVYSFHGPRMQEDLRHELTHGILHASLNTVPLWLDEGLAEYFEAGGSETGAPHPDHLRTLRRMQRRRHRPSIARLEAITDFREFDNEAYAESWGWVHYMLHGGPRGREVLIDYLAELRDAGTAASLAARFPADADTAAYQLVTWVGQLIESEKPSGIRL